MIFFLGAAFGMPGITFIFNLAGTLRMPKQIPRQQQQAFVFHFGATPGPPTRSDGGTELSFSIEISPPSSLDTNINITFNSVMFRINRQESKWNLSNAPSLAN